MEPSDDAISEHQAAGHSVNQSAQQKVR